MDIKTIEWMKKRIAKAEELQKNIETIEKQIELITNTCQISIYNSHSNKSIININKRLNNTNKNIILEFIEIFKTIKNKELSKLKEEFIQR